MKKSKGKRIVKIIILITLVLGAAGFISIKVHNKIIEKRNGIGGVLDSYKEVEVYYNGSDYGEVYGKSYAKDGYYYGYKWQCVEYVKRFYHDVLGHKMPDGYGNAKDFFDKDVPNGKLNEKRGLIQYTNGEGEKPKVDDLLIFTDTNFGHVVIISEVGDDYIEVVQQNMGKSSRDRFDLGLKDGKYYIGGKRVPSGWLRKQ